MDYYGAFRPRVVTSDAAIPVRPDRPHAFPRSVGVSLPGGRLHLYPGESVQEIRPLYPLTMPDGTSPSSGPGWGHSRSRTIPIICSTVGHDGASIVVRLLALARRSVAVSTSNGVARLYLLFPRSFRRFRARLHRLSEWLQSHEVGSAVSLPKTCRVSSTRLTFTPTA